MTRAMYERSYGAKYDANLGTKEIAAKFREDVKDAKKAGELPAGLKLSVTIERYSGGSSINVKVKGGLGCPMFNPDFLAFRQQNPHELYRNSERYTAEARAVREKLDQLLDAYNHNGSEIQYDYFDVKFYGHVDFHWEFEKACREAEEAALKPATPDPEVVTLAREAAGIVWEPHEGDEDPIGRAF